MIYTLFIHVLILLVLHYFFHFCFAIINRMFLQLEIWGLIVIAMLLFNLYFCIVLRFNQFCIKLANKFCDYFSSVQYINQILVEKIYFCKIVTLIQFLVYVVFYVINQLTNFK